MELVQVSLSTCSKSFQKQKWFPFFFLKSHLMNKTYYDYRMLPIEQVQSILKMHLQSLLQLNYKTLRNFIGALFILITHHQFHFFNFFVILQQSYLFLKVFLKDALYLLSILQQFHFLALKNNQKEFYVLSQQNYGFDN